MRSAEIVRRIGKAGWTEVRQTGSHKHFRRAILPGTVTVPHPKTKIAIGTPKSIERQGGVRLR